MGEGAHEHPTILHEGLFQVGAERAGRAEGAVHPAAPLTVRELKAARAAQSLAAVGASSGGVYSDELSFDPQLRRAGVTFLASRATSIGVRSLGSHFRRSIYMEISGFAVTACSSLTCATPLHWKS